MNRKTISTIRRVMGAAYSRTTDPDVLAAILDFEEFIAERPPETTKSALNDDEFDLPIG